MPTALVGVPDFFRFSIFLPFFSRQPGSFVILFTIWGHSLRLDVKFHFKTGKCILFRRFF